eukprot:3941571-Rhodomonas_salina.3
MHTLMHTWSCSQAAESFASFASLILPALPPTLPPTLCVLVRMLCVIAHVIARDLPRYQDSVVLHDVAGGVLASFCHRAQTLLKPSRHVVPTRQPRYSDKSSTLSVLQRQGVGVPSKDLDFLLRSGSSTA